MPGLKLKAQLLNEGMIAFGPGKADLLEAIEKTGSIAAAAREMNMSYRRAWLLADAMNRSFRSPLIVTDRGGAARGGAQVTPLGKKILARYRLLQGALERAAAIHARSLIAELAATGTEDSGRKSRLRKPGPK